MGLAIARALSNSPQLAKRSIVLLEQNSDFGQQISSRNSEVIHSGIYYPSNSLKAKHCVRGRQLLVEHCQQYDVAHKMLGKYILAQAGEEDQLEALYQQANSNGVDNLQRVSKMQLAQEEPAVRAAEALFSPSTGIVDSHGLMQSLLHLAQLKDCYYAPLTRLQAIHYSGKKYQLDCRIGKPENTQPYSFECSSLINSTGLEAQQLAKTFSTELDLKVSPIPNLYPCKGDYFSFQGKSPFNHLIYPLPDKNTRGLGIHGTLDLNGRLRFGPDAEYIDTVNYSINGAKVEQFTEAIRRYYPAIKSSQLLPDYAGIRPKLSGPGQAARDFEIFDGSKQGLVGFFQLFGIESPGLTACLSLAEELRTKVERQWQ